MKTLKNKLSQNELTIGSWITLAHTAIPEIMAKSGLFDWLSIDMEHSAITITQAQQLIQVIELCGIAPLVRVENNDPNIIKRVMDAGSHGVIVPMVNTQKEARAAVNAVKYPPVGTRGVGLGRAQGYGFKFEEYKKWVNRDSVVVVQIEHIQAMGNLEGILSTEGVDASIIGPYDLSASLGYPGEFERKELKQAIRKYTEVCIKVGKPAGFHVVHPDAKKLKIRIKEGFRFMGFGLDTLFLGTKIRDELSGLRIN